MKAIETRKTLNAAPRKIWEIWTTEEGVKSFLVKEAKIQPWVGGPYELYFGTDDEPGRQGSEGCKIVCFEPETTLSFTWNAPPHFPTLRHQHTLVTLHFQASGDGKTDLELNHTGWGRGEEWDRLFDYFKDAWGYVLDALEERIAKGPKQWAPAEVRRNQEFICTLKPKSFTTVMNTTEADRQKVGDHFKYLQQLLAEGKLILAGRTQTEYPRGYAIFEAETEAQAQAIVDNDPAVKAGVFEAELQPYAVALSR